MTESPKKRGGSSSANHSSDKQPPPEQGASGNEGASFTPVNGDPQSLSGKSPGEHFTNGHGRHGLSARAGVESARGNERSPDEEEESQLLVPSSLESRGGGTDRLMLSRQINRMQEPRRLSRDDLDERRIIYPESNNRTLVNRFRQLRTQLLEISAGKNFTLVVTGACEGAGASFVALNLAAAFAFDQSKTALIIDCNLREPNLHSLLDIIPEAGLTDFLDDPNQDIGRVIYPTGIPRLRLVPAGTRRESSAEFFTSFRMEQFMHAVRRRYPDRFIILDTSSIQDSPDARILTELCDYHLLVVPHGRVSNEAIENCVSGVDPEKFVGALVNG